MFIDAELDLSYCEATYTIFCRGHATLHLAVLVRPSFRQSLKYLNCERLSDCGASIHRPLMLVNALPPLSALWMIRSLISWRMKIFFLGYS